MSRTHLCCGGGSVAFSAYARIMGKVRRIINRLHFFFFFFNSVKQARIIYTLLGQGCVHSGSASCADFRRAFPDELSVSSFSLMGSPRYAWTAKSALSDFVESRVYACLAVIFYLHFPQNERGLLRVTPVTWKWNGYRNKNQ